MKKVFLSLAACALLLASCGESKEEKTDSVEMAEDMNDDKHDDTPMEDDAEYAVKTANASMATVDASKLAATNAASADVKKLAQTLVTDHTKMNGELTTAAASKNITLPTTPENDLKSTIDELGQKKGADFDKAYMDKVINWHKSMISNFEDEANNGKDADLKTWAANNLPTLKAHLELAENVKKGLK